MLLRDPVTFQQAFRQRDTDADRACARAAFMVSPNGFSLAVESAEDNLYMDLAQRVDPDRACRQHRRLHRALSDELPVISFPGDEATPDAVFPNNVFATAPGRLIIGHMRHRVRQREAERFDIPGFFSGMLGYDVVDLRAQPGIAELTGALIIDRGRGIGLAGMSERCDAEGAAAMHAAFGLRLGLAFDLAVGEYHSNVVLSLLASRAIVVCPDGIADPAVVAALAACYAPNVIELDAAERAAFCGNCISLAEDRVWMSEQAADALSPSSLAALERAGFAIGSVALDEIEKAGGSLRCCVGEIF